MSGRVRPLPMFSKAHEPAWPWDLSPVGGRRWTESLLRCEGQTDLGAGVAGGAEALLPLGGPGVFREVGGKRGCKGRTPEPEGRGRGRGGFWRSGPPCHTRAYAGCGPPHWPQAQLRLMKMRPPPPPLSTAPEEPVELGRGRWEDLGDRQTHPEPPGSADGSSACSD